MNQLTVLGCSMFLLFCVYSVIAQTSAIDENGNSVYGTEAVKVLKELPTVPVTQETVQRTIREYLDCTEDPAANSDREELDFLNEEVYGTLYRRNRDLFSLLLTNYQGSDTTLNMKEVFQKSIGKDFYESRREQVRIALDRKFPVLEKHDRFRRMDHFDHTADLCGDCTCFRRGIPEQGGFSAADHAIWEEQTGRRENTDGISLCNSSLLGDHSGLFRDLSYDMRSPGCNSSHTGI